MEAGLNKALLGKTDPTADLDAAKAEAGADPARWSLRLADADRPVRQQGSVPAVLDPAELRLRRRVGREHPSGRRDARADRGNRLHRSPGQERRRLMSTSTNWTRSGPIYLADMFGKDKVTLDDAEQIKRHAPRQGVRRPSSS